VIPLSQVCPGRGFPCPTVAHCPGDAPDRPCQASCRRSEQGSCLHLASGVQANLSFFFHYPGMYCHLIFMYAILPDKYDLLPGNSSDVHSVPCSNYGSHSRHGGGRAAAARWYTWAVVLPNALLCQSDASKYKERKKKKSDEYICISHAFNSWVSSQRNDGSGWLPGQRGHGECRASQPGSARVPRSGLQGVHHSRLLKQMS